jgi:hypothetical protein
VVGVPDLPHGGAAGKRHPAHLAGRQAQDAVAVVLGDELDPRAGAPRELASPSRLQLDVVDERARRDVGERERVAGLDVRRGPGLDSRADAEAGRREDVGLGAVRVVEERDARRPVRVVLDRGHLRGHAVLATLEVDDPVAALVAAALVARRDAALVVAASPALHRLEQALLGLGLRDLVEGRDRAEAPARRGWLVLAQRH